jgi:hypothetical protein
LTTVEVRISNHLVRCHGSGPRNQLQLILGIRGGCGAGPAGSRCDPGLCSPVKRIRPTRQMESAAYSRSRETRASVASPGRYGHRADTADCFLRVVSGNPHKHWLPPRQSHRLIPNEFYPAADKIPRFIPQHFADETAPFGTTSTLFPFPFSL